MTLNTTDLGHNITNAISVLKESYENINLLFTELDRVAEDEGFVSMIPRFLRWKSDSNHEGWLTSNFIKLYQLEKDPTLDKFPEMRDGYIFGIEVDLEGETYPTISLNRYEFDYSVWPRIPAISDHWVFWDPFRNDKHFNISEDNNYWSSTPFEKSKQRYWGIQQAFSKDFPLLSITSSEDIKIKIFQELESAFNKN